MRSILLIIDQTFPNQHAFLEEVYAKLFPSKGDKVTWVFRDAEKRFKFRRTQWHSTSVYTIPNENNYNLFVKLIIRSILFFWLISIIRKEKVTIIQVRNWIYGAYISSFYAMIFKMRFVYQISFPVQQADTVVGSETMRGGRLRQQKNKMKSSLLRMVLRRADIVFVISDEMKRQMLKDGVTHQNMVPIPLGYADLGKPSFKSMQDLAENLGLLDKKVLLYAGTLSFLRKPEFMLRTLKLVVEKLPNVLLLIVGGEPGEIEKLKSVSRDLSVEEKVVFAGKVPRVKVPEYTAIADICLSPIPEIPIYMVSYPTKMVEYMGAGKAVVASRIPEQEKIIQSSCCGICTEFKEENFSRAIVQLLNNDAERNEMGKRGAEYAVRYLSYDRIYEKVVESYNSIQAY